MITLRRGIDVIILNRLKNYIGTTHFPQLADVIGLRATIHAAHMVQDGNIPKKFYSLRFYDLRDQNYGNPDIMRQIQNYERYFYPEQALAVCEYDYRGFSKNERVLVVNDLTKDAWKCYRFSRYDDETQTFHVVGSYRQLRKIHKTKSFKYCISYIGNEHLKNQKL